MYLCPLQFEGTTYRQHSAVHTSVFFQVLHHLGFLSQRGTVELKGRVACEIHSHEVLLTELLFQNVFSENEPGEIAALLSCIVFQQVR